MKLLSMLKLYLVFFFKVPPPLRLMSLLSHWNQSNIPFRPYDVKIPYRASHLALFHKRPHSSPLNSVAKQSSLCAAMAQESCYAMCWTNAGILEQNFKRVVIVGSVCLRLCRAGMESWQSLIQTRNAGGELWLRARPLKQSSHSFITASHLLP